MIAQIYKKNGIFGFFKGFFSSLTVHVTYSFLWWVSYSTTRRQVDILFPSMQKDSLMFFDAITGEENIYFLLYYFPFVLFFLFSYLFSFVFLLFLFLFFSIAFFLGTFFDLHLFFLFFGHFCLFLRILFRWIFTPLFYFIILPCYF